jgi:four helix bundle protein
MEKIDERTFRFALRVVEVYRYLVAEKKEFVLSKQLLRAGTSIGANVAEAQAAQSRKDFAAKMAIASKEARETLYWIRLLQEAGYLHDYPETATLTEEIQSIINIVTRIVKTISTSPIPSRP